MRLTIAFVGTCLLSAGLVLVGVPGTGRAQQLLVVGGLGLLCLGMTIDPAASRFRWTLAHSFFVMALLAFLAPAAYHADAGLLAGTLGLALFFFAGSIALPSLVREPQLLGTIVASAVLVGHATLLAWPGSLAVQLPPVRGPYENPNSFGVAGATSFAACASLLASWPKANGSTASVMKAIGKAAVVAATVLSVLVVLASGSRTASGSVVLVGAGTLLLVFGPRLMRLQSMLRGLLGLGVIIGAAGALFLASGVLQELVIGGVVAKGVLKTNDIFDARTEVWMHTLQDVRVLGHGREYFATQLLGAHNTFISVLGQFGAIAAALFALFILVVALAVLSRTLTSPRTVAFAATGTLTFLLLSVTEGVGSRLVMLIVFVSLGQVSMRRDEEPPTDGAAENR